ncbi:MAG: OmpA family protein [Thiomicrorhabdus chilensis]|uniref:OmpA/MotB family protein n=1 Tax=Thiomicrorhabdus chilensis TaxID=63656 RepID=UPI00299EF45D|nr:flagellar motor protein MotB [Thiomicrorhabdus chilensis]MDX1347983.1 OmpA family protein [Thiomicrorhabdus chilensis]
MEKPNTPAKPQTPEAHNIPPAEFERLLQLKVLENSELLPSKKPSESEDDDWLITYADAVTILLAFFVLIFSVSEIRQTQFEVLSQSLGSTLLKKEEVRNPLSDLQSSLADVLDSHSINPIQAITLSDNSLEIDLPGELLFQTASTDLGQDSSRLIRELAAKIDAFPFKNYTIEIEGHTDDVPISNPRFPSNWQLSSGRAIAVLQLFFESGISKERLKAIGYADTRPKLPNRNQAGEPIENNRAQNRRVEIIVSRMMR